MKSKEFKFLVEETIDNKIDGAHSMTVMKIEIAVVFLFKEKLNEKNGKGIRDRQHVQVDI